VVVKTLAGKSGGAGSKSCIAAEVRTVTGVGGKWATGRRSVVVGRGARRERTTSGRSVVVSAAIRETRSYTTVGVVLVVMTLAGESSGTSSECCVTTKVGAITSVG